MKKGTKHMLPNASYALLIQAQRGLPQRKAVGEAFETLRSDGLVVPIAGRWYRTDDGVAVLQNETRLREYAHECASAHKEQTGEHERDDDAPAVGDSE